MKVFKENKNLTYNEKLDGVAGLISTHILYIQDLGNDIEKADLGDAEKLSIKAQVANAKSMALLSLVTLLK
ncbi:hypothetical protein D3C71_1560490 [compost metagenome]